MCVIEKFSYLVTKLKNASYKRISDQSSICHKKGSLMSEIQSKSVGEILQRHFENYRILFLILNNFVTVLP